MADSIYFGLDMDGKKAIAKQIARSFASFWESPISKQVTAIGGTLTSPGESSLPTVTVIAKRQPGVSGPRIGGPFESASAYLKAWIRHRLTRLEAQNEVDEYKTKLLEPIRLFVENRLKSLPAHVDKVPVVLTHADLGLHNVIISPGYPFEFRAVIDWESIACQTFLAAVPDLIQPLFREQEAGSEGCKGEDELRAAFWEEIPEWSRRKDSIEGRDFLE